MNVTIGIPFYNAGRYLASAIRSVFAQTHQEWELILMDDGSTDNSLEIARAVDDPRVSVVSDGQRRKLAARLNQIVDLARADLVARMDADDLMSPARIEKQVQIMQQSPSTDLVSTGVYSISDDEELLGARWHHAERMQHTDLVMRRGCGIVHASVLGKRAWFERNRYDTSLPIAQDFELWVRASRADDLDARLLLEPLYFYRETANVTLHKLLHAYEVDRLALWRHRRSALDLHLILRSHLKSLAATAIASAGRLEWLLKRRHTAPATTEIRQRFLNELQIIRATRIPGLD